MQEHHQYMHRCLELAALGRKYTAPNPMVGSVIVHKGRIIGEGYHQKCGGPHAEVHAVQSVDDPSLLKESTIYVSLEPCAHFGKTPPCSDLIIASGIPHVVIATVDPFSKVKGKGIEKLKRAGCKVEVGILEEEARALNKRFFTYHTEKRPYIILKWAQSLDGFIDKIRMDASIPPTAISGKTVKTWVHQTRSEEASILVGKNTALLDNPQLTPRLVDGTSPLRLVLDKNLELPPHLHLLDGSTPTAVFTTVKSEAIKNFTPVILDPQLTHALPQQVCDFLYKNAINSLIVEGGTQVLEQFIASNLWDEARIITAPKRLEKGIKAPTIFGSEQESYTLDKDTVKIIYNA